MIKTSKNGSLSMSVLVLDAREGMSLSKLAGYARRQVKSSFKRNLARQCRSEKRHPLTPLRARSPLDGRIADEGFLAGSGSLR
jgi:hypothetical protein